MTNEEGYLGQTEPGGVDMDAESTPPPRRPRPRVSEAQLRANRENAKRSTGPRTPEGKAISSKNAGKHWILSRRIIIPGEDPDELEDLYQGFIRSFRPRDFAQEQCVERMVSATWRKRRAEGVESDYWDWEDGMSRKGFSAAHSFWMSENSDKNIQTIVRYMANADREFYRALQALKLLQSDFAVYECSAGGESHDDDQVAEPRLDRGDAAPADGGSRDDAPSLAIGEGAAGEIGSSKEELWCVLKRIAERRLETAKIGKGEQLDVEFLEQEPLAAELLERMGPDAAVRFREGLSALAEKEEGAGAGSSAAEDVAGPAHEEKK